MSFPPPKPKTSEKTDQSHVLKQDPMLGRKLSDSQAALNQQPLTTSTPLRDNARSQLIDSLTVVNQQIVAGLARQNLPKCQPDVFFGDPTLFHPWKSAFKAMLIDTEVSPIQEINYLRSFTSGTPQRLVDNYRKRQMRDPVALLRDLWEELERRFGSAAVISNSLLDRLRNSATFGEHDNENLQQFADLCADIESQVTYLPGLACLNYPSAIQPVTEKLPQFIPAKWEKEIAHYNSDLNGGTYPPFSRFSEIVKEQAKIKNNPNLLANKEAKPRREKKTLKTDMQPPDEKKGDSGNEKREGRHGKSKHCPFHDRPGHDLSGCKTFLAKALEERTQWIKDARLCFRCFSPTHIASRCNVPLRCTICGDRRHSALLHRERQPPPKSENEGVNPKCTTLCGPSGGVSCSKTLLVDVYSKRNPHLSKRIYAIIDEQSNSSLVTSELADHLGARGPSEKYFLSTCSGEKEEKHGRRVPEIMVRSLSGPEFPLPTLTECDTIPQDKSEIPTPDMAKRFPHLIDIAHEIPSPDESAKIQLLIGRDAPELLKVRQFRNGPRGASWAQ